jgi:hypothetical protein
VEPAEDAAASEDGADLETMLSCFVDKPSDD